LGELPEGKIRIRGDRGGIIMKAKTLVVDLESAYEPVTEIGYEFRVRKYVYPNLRAKEDMSVIALFGEDATKLNFTPACSIRTVDFITGLGHGNNDVFTGQEGEVLWRVGNYDSQETTGKIIHLLSCLTARRLGYDLVDNGALAYFGYNEEFAFVTSASPPPDITEDPFADPFFKCDSEIDRLIAECHQANEVYGMAMDLYQSEFNKLVEVDVEAAKWLRHDMQALRRYGNPNVSLCGKREIYLNTPVSGKLFETGDSRVYILKGVEKGGKLLFDLDGPSDVNFDLYVRYSLEPTLDNWDYRGCAGLAKEKITVDPTKAGDYYIMVYSYEGSGIYTLTALPPGDDAEAIQIDVPVCAELSEGEAKYYMLKAEEAGKELIVNLEGPSGADFDIYLKYGLKPDWQEWDDRGYTSTANETMRAYPTKKGNYYIMVHAYRGSGEYTLKASVN
jgi:hypothetical protein